MVKVTVNGKTIAESNETIIVENNHYFPPKSVDKSLFTDSKTRCDPPPSCSVARLTPSASGHTALFALGKGSPSLTPPPSDKLTSQHPPSGPPRITTPQSTANPSKTSRGITPNPKKRQTTSRTTWPFTRYVHPLVSPLSKTPGDHRPIATTNSRFAPGSNRTRFRLTFSMSHANEN